MVIFVYENSTTTFIGYMKIKHMTKEYFIKFTKFESNNVNLYTFKPIIHKDIKEICGYLNGFSFYTCWKLPYYVLNSNPYVKLVNESGIIINYTHSL